MFVQKWYNTKGLNETFTKFSDWDECVYKMSVVYNSENYFFR